MSRPGIVAAWRARRRPLIDARKAVFAAEDTGVRDPDRYAALRGTYEALASVEPWWVRAWIRETALAEHAEDIGRKDVKR